MMLKEICKMFIYMCYLEVYYYLGIVFFCGVFFYGLLGCGKILFVYVIVGEFDLLILKVVVLEIVFGVFGEFEQKLRELFE